MSDAQVLITGKHFSGSGLRAIGPVLHDLVASTKQELHVMAYLLSESAAPLLDELERALERGVKATIVLNDIDACPQHVKERLQFFSRRFPHARVVNFQDEEGGQLHAKVLVADRARAIVGSANLTWGGMVTNHEIALLVQNGPAWVLASLIDRLAMTLGH